jgi:hypothetical protein
MDQIQRGDWLLAQAADGESRELRALGGVIAGGDFAVVWACSPTEWTAADNEEREPQGIPWPAEDARVVEHAPA